MEIGKGDVYACEDCSIEMVITKGGECKGLTCCGKPMLKREKPGPEKKGSCC